MIHRLLIAMVLVTGASAAWAAPDPGELAFRQTYRTLVETDTTLAHGDCTLAAARMGDILRAAGFAPSQLIAYAAPDHPKEGGLVAILPGTTTTIKPLLLLAHIDVVEARRADWAESKLGDPFVLIEQDGYFHARGAYDDKAQAAIFVDALANLAHTHARLRRTVKLALTCGEETHGAFNGAQWLAANRRDLIDAEFALNEGGGGLTDGKAVSRGGAVIAQTIQVGEKTFANFAIETRNRGGHSAVPRPDNAIYQLAHALDRIEGYTFPIEFNPTTLAYFRGQGTARVQATGDIMGRAMVALAADPTDKAALWQIDTDPLLHSMIRTTCVATLLDAGHAANALPQHARATVNCRILPGHSIAETGHELEHVIGDPEVSVTALPPLRPAPPPPPLTPPPPLPPGVIEPAARLVAKYWPGVTLMPVMASRHTDATFLTAAGIPTYGVPGLWGDPDGNGIHGLDERIEIRSLLTGRAFLNDLIGAYTK